MSITEPQAVSYPIPLTPHSALARAAWFFGMLCPLFVPMLIQPILNSPDTDPQILEQCVVILSFAFGWFSAWRLKKVYGSPTGRVVLLLYKALFAIWITFMLAMAFSLLYAKLFYA